MDAKQLLDEVLNKITALSQERDALKAELDAMRKPSETNPTFEVGKWYRTRGGGVKRVECRFDDNKHYKLGGGGTSWTEQGRVWYGREHPNDLIPGEVITWQAPASLPDGVWMFCNDGWILDNSQAPLMSNQLAERSFKDWTDPPKFGKWRVVNGVGVWDGE